MATATQPIPAMVPAIVEALRSISATDRLKLLRELVKLCFTDRSLDKPLQVMEEGDLFRAYVMVMFPRTKTPPPELTPEEEAEIQRRIANRHNAISHEEFVERVRRLIRERKSEGS